MQSLPRFTRDGMSKNNSGKGWRSLPNNNGPKHPNLEKRNQKLQRRADKKRTVNALLQTSRNDKGSSMGETAGEALKNGHQSKEYSKLSLEDTLKIMNKERGPETEIINKELEEIEEEADNLRRNADLEKEQAAYKHTVMNTKVPCMAT